MEGADWGLTLAGEQALAQQLRSILGAGVLRLDPRLPVRRNLLAEAGLAAAGLEGDWQGAGAVWLLEPQTEDIQRAQRAGVRVIVDTTLAPGGQWLQLGADLLTYHHAATLTGFAAEELALLFGLGERPRAAAPAAADLTVALALRDVATLPLRLARAAQTVSSLEGQMQGRALPLGPTALLLPPKLRPPQQPHWAAYCLLRGPSWVGSSSRLAWPMPGRCVNCCAEKCTRAAPGNKRRHARREGPNLTRQHCRRQHPPSRNLGLGKGRPGNSSPVKPG
ncbi:hypothetical protein [Deinococcus radiophilus]|uniref:hypothetical protein n=1 Tax=Deinococcus radiophilus TaxID=32062 RepID=UPI0036079F42